MAVDLIGTRAGAGTSVELERRMELDRGTPSDRARPLLRLAVLVSGGGTNLQALIDASRSVQSGRLGAEIAVVISSRPDAFALERACGHGIPAVCVERRGAGSIEAYGEALLSAVEPYHPGLVALAGFLPILPEAFIARFRHRLMNVHPSLLPAFGGRGMYGDRVHRAVLEAGVKVSGCTVHFVEEEIDAGPIILQAAVPVLEDDTPEILAGRVHEQEHRLYPEAVRYFAEGRLLTEGRRVRILPPPPRIFAWERG